MSALCAAMPKCCKVMLPLPARGKLTSCHVRRCALGTLVLDRFCCTVLRTGCSVDRTDSATLSACSCDRGAGSTGGDAGRILLVLLPPLWLLLLLVHSNVNCTVV